MSRKLKCIDQIHKKYLRKHFCKGFTTRLINGFNEMEQCSLHFGGSSWTVMLSTGHNHTPNWRSPEGWGRGGGLESHHTVELKATGNIPQGFSLPWGYLIPQV